MAQGCLPTAAIGKLFAEQVEELSGHVAERFDNGRKMYARSLLPFIEEVRRGDRLQGGLALRATAEEISLHPYLFRQLGTNGLIMARFFHTRNVEMPDDSAPTQTLQALRQAIRQCAAKEVFVREVDKVKAAMDDQGDLERNLIPAMARLGRRLDPAHYAQILERFSRDGEGTRYGLVNAVTLLARDTSDQEQRWRLEEIGGAIAVRTPARTSSEAQAAETESTTDSQS